MRGISGPASLGNLLMEELVKVERERIVSQFYIKRAKG